MAKLTPGQEGAGAGRGPLELPPVDGPCWTSARLAISREWVAFKKAGRVPWNVIPYATISALRPAAAGGGVAVGWADGPGVVIGKTVLGSPEACRLLAAGLSTNPAVAPAVGELLQPYLEADRLKRDSPGRRHTLDRSGTTHTFRFHRGRHLSFGILALVSGAACLAIAAAPGTGAWWGEVLFLVIFGLALVWLGVRQFWVGVQISAGKVAIRNSWRTRTVDASEIRAITLRPHVIGEGNRWVPRVELTGGREVWIENFDCGPEKRPAKPELVAAVGEVRALLRGRADNISPPESRPVHQDGGQPQDRVPGRTQAAAVREQNKQELVQALLDQGYMKSPRSDVYFLIRNPDFRVKFGKTVVRFEVRSEEGGGRPWKLGVSYLLTRERAAALRLIRNPPLMVKTSLMAHAKAYGTVNTGRRTKRLVSRNADLER